MDTAQLLPSPRLAHEPVQALLTALAALPWLSHPYGLVQTGVRVVDGKNELFPQLYPQDGGRVLLDLRPDESMQALAFFEREGASAWQWDEGAEGVAGHWQHPLALVVWCNLPRIDSARPDDFSGELAEDVLRVLWQHGATLTEGTRLEQRPERVFERYRWPVAQHQLLTYPYAAFRLTFTVSSAAALDCAPAFTVTP